MVHNGAGLEWIIRHGELSQASVASPKFTVGSDTHAEEPWPMERRGWRGGLREWYICRWTDAEFQQRKTLKRTFPLEERDHAAVKQRLQHSALRVRSNQNIPPPQICSWVMLHIHFWEILQYVQKHSEEVSLLRYGQPFHFCLLYLIAGTEIKGHTQRTGLNMCPVLGVSVCMHWGRATGQRCLRLPL